MKLNRGSRIEEVILNMQFSFPGHVDWFARRGDNCLVYKIQTWHAKLVGGEGKETKTSFKKTLKL